MKLIERHACCGGWQEVWQHAAQSLHCQMKIAIYLPPQAEQQNLPVLYWLSGLSCTEQNFITKAGAQRYAAKNGIILVAPDTSPRGENVADDPAYDLGQGAGFYINATALPWQTHYQMYDYVLTELPALIKKHFPATEKQAISGHSMGGHGALILALNNPDHYVSVSAFSPIVAPGQAEWGKKIFGAYLGNDKEKWQQYDAVELIRSGKKLPEIFVDQGLDDPFYETQLHTRLLKEICDKQGIPNTIRLHPGYDHSYYFIASFIADHIDWHTKKLVV